MYRIDLLFNFQVNISQSVEVLLEGDQFYCLRSQELHEALHQDIGVEA